MESEWNCNQFRSRLLYAFYFIFPQVCSVCSGSGLVRVVMEGFWAVFFPVLRVWFTCLVVLIMLPAMFGISLGITETYMKILIKTLEWATHRIQRASRAEEILKHSASNGLIQRDNSSLEQEIEELRRDRPKSADHGDFTLSDVLYFTRRGIESIVEDDVTQRFTSEELVSWNLLTRTNNNFQYISLRLTVLWGVGVVVRYCILLPLRITLTAIGLSWLVIGTTMVGFLPNFRQNRPKRGGICVANHTSPIDVVILANDGCYAMVGQVHGGLMGVVQRAMERSCPHIWFERAEMKDRHLVTQR
ncbi:hypothetical protein cypCar_00014471 [Cyprinus carpio]|nr:hypothetical protein cypCar_00014471 [Cyprinus carpio]